MTRRAYTPQERQKAIDLAVEFGPAEASRLTGIRAGTIASWCSRAGIATVAAEKTAAAVEAHKITMEERRARLADQLMRLAELGAQHAEPLMAEATLRDLVGAWDYAIKNAQLLSGGATSRTETLAGEQVQTVIDELARRRRVA